MHVQSKIFMIFGAYKLQKATNEVALTI